MLLALLQVLATPTGRGGSCVCATVLQPLQPDLEGKPFYKFVHTISLFLLVFDVV